MNLFRLRSLAPAFLLLPFLLAGFGFPAGSASAAGPSEKKESSEKKDSKVKTPPKGREPNDAGRSEITEDFIRSRIKKIEEGNDLEPSVKSEALDFYRHALDLLGLSDEWKNKAESAVKEKEGIPARLDQLRKELEQPVAEPKIEIPKEETLVQLEQRQAQAEAELAAARQKLADWDSEPKRRADRRLRIPNSVSDARARLDEVEKELNVSTPTAETQEIRSARRLILRIQRQAIEQELNSYAMELAKLDTASALLPIERDRAERRVTEAEKVAKAWEGIVNERRRQDSALAEEKAREAEREAMNAHPAVRSEVERLAQESTLLAQRRTGEAGLTSKIEKISKVMESTDKQYEKVSADFKSARAKVEAAGLTGAVGLLLRKNKAELPDLRRYRAQRKARQLEITDAQVQLLDLQDQRSALPSVESALAEIMGGLGSGVQETQRKEIESTVRGLLQGKRENLTALKTDYDSYFAKLVDLDAAEERLFTQAKQYSDFIDERVLWIRSAAPLGVHDLPKLQDALQWLLGAEGWLAALKTLQRDVVRNALIWLAALIVAAVLIVLRRRMRQSLLELGDKVFKGRSESISHTFDALILTLGLSMFVPAIIGFIGWRLGTAWDAPDLTKGITEGLQKSAAVFWSAEFFRQLCRPKGVADAHFGWTHESLGILRRNIAWLMSAGIPILFVLEVMQKGQANETRWESLGRIVFISSSVLLAVFSYRLFNTNTGVLRITPEEKKDGRKLSWRYAGFLLAVGIHVALGTLALFGYTYTALQLAGRLQSTALLCLSLVVIHETTLRWVFLARRRLAIGQYKRRKEAEAEAREGGAAEALAAAPDIDLAAVNLQLRRLLRGYVVFALFLGVYLIWVDVLPALGVFKRVELWSHTARTASNGLEGAAAKMIEVKVPVTLADLLLALAIFLLTIIAGRNLPALLEISILQRLHVESGLRYALTTTSRYLVTVIGSVIAFKMIGISWSDVQWLAAAITVGLGFGLQEIFANFISGIIILFERPVRVGDTVTVGGITGTVSRIRIRATTITDAEKRELIVPNKEFITGRVMNWTLTDTMQRVTVHVGAPYGADPQRVESILLGVARENPLTLASPPPSATLKAFGPNALEFELCAFVAGPEHSGSLKRQLHHAVLQAFRQAGIAIALPQLDVHLHQELK